MSKTSTLSLEAQIESLVREHIAASEAAVAAAVRRAFAKAEPACGRSGVTRGAPAPSGRVRRAQNPRRSAAQLDALAEKLCSAIVEEPGLRMAELSPKVGASAGELSVVASRLRRAERVRTVGQRQYTKYFPAAPAPLE